MKSEILIVARPTDRSTGHGWLGIPAALAAVAMNSRWFAARQPRTSLRVLSLIAIDAALRSRGTVLRPDLRRAVIEAMELGALLNDRFDGDAYDPNELRARLAWFAKSAHREVVRGYVKRLRRLERSRPAPGECATAVRIYRESVNLVSLAALWALAHARTLENAELEIQREADLRLLFQIVMQAQLIDDVMDVRQDSQRCLPSFATAPDATAASLRALVAIYADSNPDRFDRNFCLRVALRIVAASARVMIAIRAAGAGEEFKPPAN